MERASRSKGKAAAEGREKEEIPNPKRRKETDLETELDAESSDEGSSKAEYASVDGVERNARVIEAMCKEMRAFQKVVMMRLDDKKGMPLWWR